MELVVFGILAALAVVSAAAMIFARNLVHAVLWMVANFATIAVMYITLSAPFVAVVQVAVYAGAIMVLFLFVVMLLGEQQLSFREQLAGQRLFAAVFGVLLLGLLGLTFLTTPILGTTSTLSVNEMGRRNAQLVGGLLYSDYLLPFEITSVLLLIAMIGAVVIAKRRLL